MPHLPKKIILFITSISFFIFLFLPKNKIHALDFGNTDDIQRQIDDLEKIKTSEEIEINNLTVGKANIDASMVNGIRTIVPLHKDDKNSALPYVSQMMVSLYNHPPASLAWYIQDTLAHAGFIKPAYAQGIGFAGMAPLLPVWKATRNIAYMVIIFIMVVIGFMIIFRTKIDPKTVISVQAALPKVVVALLLITFSYPIVGFLIDMMYLSIAIIVSVLASGFGMEADIAKLQQAYMTNNWLQLAGTIFSGGFASLGDFFGVSSGGQLKGGSWGAIGSLITAGVAAIPFNWPAFLVAGGIALVLLLIIVLGLLFTYIRLLIIIFNSYLQIIINLLIAPIILLGEAIPGKSTFGNWIKGMLANLSVFPSTVAILMFAKYLTEANIYTAIWRPPFTLPRIGGEWGSDSFTGFLGLAMIFIAPTLVATIKKSFGAKPTLPISMGTAMAPLSATTQTTMGAASQFYYLQNMPFIGGLMGGRKGGAAGSGHT